MPDRPRPPLESVVAQYQTMLLDRATRLCRNPAIAEELVQDTFARALVGYDKLEPKANVGAWLVTILTNKFFDYFRRQKVEQKAVPQLVALTEVMYDPAIARVSVAQLHAALAELTPPHREVIDLCYMQKLSYEEAGRRLGINPGTVGSRLHKAIQELKKRLVPRGES